MVNSLLVVIWGFSLAVLIVKCNGGRNIKLADTIGQFTALLALSFVAMSMTSMYSDYMPDLIGLIK